MDLQSLHMLLAAEGFRPDAYDLGGKKLLSETYVVEERDGGWVTFYAERGLETSLAMFPTLAEASQELLHRLRGDPTTRRAWRR